MEKLATKSQKLAIRRNCLWNEDVKCELVQWVKDDNNQTSLNSLTFEEANKILQAQGDKPHKAEKWAFFDKENPKHKIILSLMHQLRWTTYYRGNIVPDLDRLSEWLQSKAPVKKPLKKMADIELEKTITALTNITKQKWQKA